MADAGRAPGSEPDTPEGPPAGDDNHDDEDVQGEPLERTELLQRVRELRARLRPGALSAGRWRQQPDPEAEEAYREALDETRAREARRQARRIEQLRQRPPGDSEDSADVEDQ